MNIFRHPAFSKTFLDTVLAKTAEQYEADGMTKSASMELALYTIEKHAGILDTILKGVGAAFRSGADEAAAGLKGMGSFKPVKNVANTADEAAGAVAKQTGGAGQSTKAVADASTNAPKMKFQFNEGVDPTLTQKLQAMGINTLAAAGRNPGTALAVGAGGIGLGGAAAGAMLS